MAGRTRDLCSGPTHQPLWLASSPVCQLRLFTSVKAQQLFIKQSPSQSAAPSVLIKAFFSCGARPTPLHLEALRHGGSWAWKRGTPFHLISTNTYGIFTSSGAWLSGWRECMKIFTLLPSRYPLSGKGRVRQGGKKGPRRKAETVQNHLKFV